MACVNNEFTLFCLPLTRLSTSVMSHISISINRGFIIAHKRKASNALTSFTDFPSAELLSPLAGSGTHFLSCRE